LRFDPPQKQMFITTWASEDSITLILGSLILFIIEGKGKVKSLCFFF